MAKTKDTRPWCYWEESRQMWRAQELMPDGKYHNIRAKTQKELRAKIDATRAEIQQQIDAVAEQAEAAKYPTVAEVAERWLAATTPTLSGNGAGVLTNAVNNHIVPAMGSMRIDVVLPADIDTLMGTINDASMSLRGKVLNTASRIFDYAVDNEMCVKNPCVKKKAGGKKSAEKEPLTDNQAKTLLSALDSDRSRRAYVFCAVGLYAGLRREEILGLAWEDVSLDPPAPHINVTHAVVFNGQRPTRTNILKTKAARRTIPIPTTLSEILRQEKATSRLAVFAVEHRLETSGAW